MPDSDKQQPASPKAKRFAVRQHVFAMQFNSLEDYLSIFSWMDAEGDTFAQAKEIRYSTPVMLLQTWSGTVPVNPGDWVVHHEGKFSVCPDHLFRALYQPD